VKDRLLRTSVGTYKAAEWSGENTSGCWPIGDSVLVLPDEAATKIGGIHLADDSVEKMTMAAESGVIVALGDGAFEWTADRMRRWSGYRPQVGDRVRIERYAGGLQVGNDGRTYRLMTDKCIGAIESAGRPQELDRVARAGFGETGTGQRQRPPTDATGEIGAALIMSSVA